MLHQPYCENKGTWNMCYREKKTMWCEKWKQVGQLIFLKYSLESSAWNKWPGQAVRLGSKWKHGVWCSSQGSVLGALIGLCTVHWETPAKRPHCLLARIPSRMRADARHPTSSYRTSARHTLGVQCVLTELSCSCGLAVNMKVKKFMYVHHALSSGGKIQTRA